MLLFFKFPFPWFRDIAEAVVSIRCSVCAELRMAHMLPTYIIQMMDLQMFPHSRCVRLLIWSHSANRSSFLEHFSEQNHPASSNTSVQQWMLRNVHSQPHETIALPNFLKSASTVKTQRPGHTVLSLWEAQLQSITEVDYQSHSPSGLAPGGVPDQCCLNGVDIRHCMQTH